MDIPCTRLLCYYQRVKAFKALLPVIVMICVQYVEMEGNLLFVMVALVLFMQVNFSPGVYSVLQFCASQ